MNEDSAEHPAIMNSVADLLDLALQTDARGPVWTVQSDDLNVNLIVLPAGEAIAEHVNSEVDVLVLPVSGSGNVTIEGEEHKLKVGDAIVISRGSRRGISSHSDPFAYLTCHRRRQGLWPKAK
jgi:quercetin dioxygenase-like cupin family protein